MLKKGYQWRAGAALGLAWGAVLLGRGAGAAEVHVALSCAEWSTEQVSQVEARIRAALLLEDSGARRVLIVCEGGGVAVIVESSTAQLTRPVVLGSGSLEDSIIQTVDQALRDLQSPPSAPPLEPEPPPSPPAKPVPSVLPSAPVTVSSPAASTAPPVTVPPPARLELSLGVLGERWAKHNALGARAAASLGSEQLRYGIELGGLAALGEPNGFDVNEWHVGARLSWAPSWLLGVRGNLGLGGSLFLAAPQGLSVDSATSLGAGFAELGLSRPFWLGAFAVSPELGLRASSAERRVRINEVERLVWPVLVPAASLSLVWRQR
ncbi:MAG TPA: hypothetical protein VHP33_20560 [Polyangiaceae bacterium]|nr:hypothetical protein [Polyangiaceae bacterium]